MAVPTLGFYLALTALPRDPFSSVVWTDISPYVEQFDYSRGRHHWTDSEEPGRGTFVLNNRDHRFDPLNSASPYYPYLLPMRRISVTGTYAGVLHYLHTAFVDEFPVVWPDETSSLLTVQSQDLLAWLALAQVAAGTAVPQESTGNRVARLLNLAGISSADYDCDAGTGIMPAATLSRASFLSYIQAAELAEGGRFFVRGDGKFLFYGRSRRLGAVTPEGVWGNGPGEFPYRAPLQYGSAKDDLFNDVTGTATGSTEQEVSDTASDDAYGTRSLPMGTIDLNSDPQVLDRITYELARHKDATVRVPAMTYCPSDQPDDLWPGAFRLELDQRITVKAHWAGSTLFDEDGLIEGLSFSWAPESPPLMTYSLSMIDATRYWLLGSSTLGVDTRLGF